uniref:PE-PGRS family protein n=1 Tax=Streptomyces sp. NBC_00003 TaxID=2903608 RepID=A0AAU2V0D8_9ACTN
MIKQVLAGAAFATAATMAVAAPASATAHTTGPQPHKTAANAIQNLLATPLGQSPTTSGTGCGCIGDAVSGITGNGTTGNLTSTVTGTATGAGTGTGTTGTGTGTGTTTGTGTGTGTTTGAGGSGASASGNGATDFSTRNGDTVIGGEEGAGGILNTYGASLINVDGRCLVPLPEGEGIGGHGLGGPKAACNIAPVDQYQAPQKLL